MVVMEDPTEAVAAPMYSIRMLGQGQRKRPRRSCVHALPGSTQTLNAAPATLWFHCLRIRPRRFGTHSFDQANRLHLKWQSWSG